MILLLDNYDSFTYNIAQYLKQLGAQVIVSKNDAISLSDIEAINPSAIVLGPGPGSPNNAGITLECIRFFADKLPILGICLGHQAIAQAFGADIVRAKHIMHGRISLVYHHQTGIFESLKSPTEFTRYHSLIIDKNTLPDTLEVTAWTQDMNDINRVAVTKVMHGLNNLTDEPFLSGSNDLVMDNELIQNDNNSLIKNKEESLNDQVLDTQISEIMAIRHKYLPIEGVQFHPESILSHSGLALFKNFLSAYNLL